jgi:hypothetical protein
MKYKIGDTIKDTDAFGTVTVIDTFRSEKGQHCYLVKSREEDDLNFLCWEGELNTGQWRVY